MNTLKPGLFFAILFLGARLTLAAADAPVTPPANTPTLPTAVPAIGVWLVPAGDVFKSWADYPQSLSQDAAKIKIRPIINSMETVIRRADTGQPVTRIPYQGVIGSALDDERPGRAEFVADVKTQDSRNSTFPDDQLKTLAKNPPGDYLLAVYVNGMRASNVVKVRIDPAFDVAKAPTLALGPIEPGPRAPYGRVVLWAIGPTTPDPGLIDYYLATALLVADGVQQRLPSMDRGQGGPSPSGPRMRGISGPPPTGLQFLNRRPLTSGERMAVLLRVDLGRLGNYTPTFDFSVPHTYALTYYMKEGHGNPGDSGYSVVESREYDAAPLTFIPKASPLGDAWDKASPPDETRPIAPPAASLPAADALGSAVLSTGTERSGQNHDFYFTESGGKTPAGGGAPIIYVGGVVQGQNHQPIYAICLICDTLATSNSEGPAVLHYDGVNGIITAIEGHPINPSLSHQAIYALQPDYSLKELPLSTADVQTVLASLDHVGQSEFPSPIFTATFTAKVYPYLHTISTKRSQP